MKWLILLALCSCLDAQVPFERILHADAEPGNWLTYSRDLGGQRYSPISEINRQNVSHLKVKWAHQFANGTNEVSPIVMDGIIYISGPNTAAALDARTGRNLWEWSRPIPADYRSVGFGLSSRGPAVLDDKLFVATLDGFLVALDLKSGAQRWSTQVVDYKLGYSMTMAPLAIDGKVVVGISGGEAGIRGLIDAYDAKNGRRAWRFWTIPGPGDPGHETWMGDSWKTGGGSTWVTGAYDPELKLVYWGVGNPGPDWNGDRRQGDNLYTCSLVALDADSGKLRWYFQFTPHDTHDWDSAHVPVLFDGEVNGAKRKLVAVANRNAFYYVLDRVTGKFVAGRAYATQTWAKGLDAEGKPIPAEDANPTQEGRTVWPNANGATVWYSTSFSPETGYIYVSAREIGARYFKRTLLTSPAPNSSAAAKMNCQPKTHGVQFAPYKPAPENSAGSSGCIRRLGQASWPPLAGWSSQARTKEVSMLSTPIRENRSGIFKPAGASSRTLLLSTWMAMSVSPLQPTVCCSLLASNDLGACKVRFGRRVHQRHLLEVEWHVPGAVPYSSSYFGGQRRARSSVQAALRLQPGR